MGCIYMLPCVVTSICLVLEVTSCGNTITIMEWSNTWDRKSQDELLMLSVWICGMRKPLTSLDLSINIINNVYLILGGIRKCNVNAYVNIPYGFHYLFYVIRVYNLYGFLCSGNFNTVPFLKFRDGCVSSSPFWTETQNMSSNFYSSRHQKNGK